MTKPLIFISHIHEDQLIAAALESMIQEALLGGVEMFNASNRQSLAVGDPWRDLIIERLGTCRTLLVVATPDSVRSPWVNFEAGGAWVSGKRVIPCCAKGMQPTSLPAPLSHLQAIDISSANGTRSLIEFLASVASLNAPGRFDYEEAAKALNASWISASTSDSNEDFLSWITKAQARPKKLMGGSSVGLAKVSHISDVDQFEADQLRSHGVVAGDSVKCWVEPLGRSPSTLFNCFANGPAADLLADVQLPADLRIRLKCVGQIKVFETIIEMSDPERGISYPTAFLIDSVEETKR